jgi:hypothetical protein
MTTLTVRLRTLLLLSLSVLIVAALPATAHASPEDTVAGAGKKWYPGSMLQTYGTNCSTAILGSAYSEVMVNGFVGYGGAPSGGAVRTGDKYWVTLTLGVPGNPCPHGSDIIATDLVLPPGTSYDGTRQVRCFSTPRHSNAWYESTNEGWDMRPIGVNAYGRTCPTGPTPSASGYGIGFDFRGLANGQMFEMFIPVTSSQVLSGGNSKFTWVVSPTLSYSPGSTSVGAFVMSSSAPTSPFLYFSREPSVVPFWNKTSPAGQENMAEVFVNLFSNYQPGTLCYKLYAGSSASGAPVLNCAGFNGTVDASSDTWFAKGPGPNGGATPFFFDYPVDYGQTFTIQWTFTPSSGPPVSSPPITFKALNGIDEDTDGVANDGTDQCPAVKGSLPNGCNPPEASADGDGDGVNGAADRCPGLTMIGAADGCPTLTAGLGKLPALKRDKLAKGVSFPVTCSLDTPVSAKLTIKKSVAKKLKLKVKKGAKSVTIATAKGKCTAKSGAKLKLKLSSKAKKPVSKSKKSISASLSVTFTPAGGVAPTTTAKSVKLK